MKLADLSRLSLALALCATATAQLREDVRFHIDPGPIGTGRAVYVVGDLPELGGNDVVRGVRLADSGNGWHATVSLPVNTSYTYRFWDRASDAAQIGNPANGTPIGPLQNGSTTLVPLSPVAKRLLCHTRFTVPKLVWRQGGGAFTVTPMQRVGPGRVAGESRWEVVPFGAARRDVEFYVLGSGAGEREPASGTYTTPLDAFFLQDGALFGYVPAASVTPHRRDYVVASPPTIASTILNESRGYRVMLPRGYDQHTHKSYPVLYLHDGGLWFDDAAPADRDADTLAELVRLGRVGEMIVVCIDHAVTSDPRVFFTNRVRDFVPPGDFGLTPWGPVAGQADRYVAFLRTELIPVVESRYRTLPGPENRWTAGFSAGAVAALYMGWDHSDAFGRAGAFAGQFETPMFLGRIATQPSRALRVYLDSGTVNDYYDLATIIYDELVDRADTYTVERELRFSLGVGQTHTVADVGLRYPGFLQFLHPAIGEPNELLCGAVPYGRGLGGNQVLVLDWNPSGVSAGAFDVSGAAASSIGLLAIGVAPARIDLAGIPILIDPALIVSIPLLYDPAGRSSLPFDLRIPSVAGLTFYVQGFELRAGTPFASGGLELLPCR